MTFMQEIVQQALNTGFLSIAAKKQIRVLLQTKYDSEDLDAYIILQRAVAAGDVKQESHSRKLPLSSSRQDASSIKLAYQNAAEMTFAVAVALSMTTKSQRHPSAGR